MAQSQILKINKSIGLTSVSFTPAFYKRAFKNYQQGDFRDLLALIDRAEIHGFVSGCLYARSSGYKRKYSVVPASDSSQDTDIAAFLTEYLSEISMREFLEDMHEARMKYYSVLALGDWGLLNGKQVPLYYEKYDQKYFTYDPKDFILKIDMGKTLEEIPEESAFVIEASRKPIMLSVLADFILLEFGKESWSSFLEVFGEPLIYGEYPLGYNKDQITEAEAGINKIASSNRGILPEGSKLHVITGQSGAGATGHKDFVQDAKANISFTLLGHTEAAGSDRQMQIGDTEASMVATTKIAEDDMFWLEEKIKPFFKLIVNRNFNVTKYPKLILDKSTIIDPKTKLTAAQLAFENGAEIDPDFFKEYGIPVLNSDPLKKQNLFDQLGGD
jgi:phage gp29-like protein